MQGTELEHSFEFIVLILQWKKAA